MKLNLSMIMTIWFVFGFGFLSFAAGPHPIVPPSTLGAVKSIYSDKSLAFCAIDMKDLVTCWALDVSDDSLISNVPADLGPVKSLSVQYYHACAIDQNDNVRCWGDDYQMPDEDGQFNLVVPEVAKKAKYVSAGPGNDCVVTLENKVLCWNNNSGKAYDLTLEFPNVAKLSAYLQGACAIDDAQNVLCHSNNPDWYKMVAPSEKAIKTDFDDWATGCILTSENTVKCFGLHNEQNQLTPADLGVVKDMSVGRGNACAVKSDNTIQCWTIWPTGSYQSVGTPFTDKVTSVATGFMSGCGILQNDNTVKCWNSYPGK